MLRTLWKGSRPLTATGLLMLPVLLAAAIGLAIDPRYITGAPAWLHLNKVLAIAVGERQARAVRLDVYRVS